MRAQTRAARAEGTHKTWSFFSILTHDFQWFALWCVLTSTFHTITWRARPTPTPHVKLGASRHHVPTKGSEHGDMHTALLYLSRMPMRARGLLASRIVQQEVQERLADGTGGRFVNLGSTGTEKTRSKPLLNTVVCSLGVVGSESCSINLERGS